MTRFLSAFFLSIACLLLAPSPVARAGADVSTATLDAEALSGLEFQTFNLINQYRKENKLPLLEWNPAVAKIARGHSRDMADGEVDFGHGGFHQRVTQMKTAMSGVKGAGENVLRTDDPNGVAQMAVKTWLNSPHHLENIRGDYNFSGLGVWQDSKGMIYFTQIFLKVQPSKQTAQNAPAPAVVTPFANVADPAKTR